MDVGLPVNPSAFLYSTVAGFCLYDRLPAFHWGQFSIGVCNGYYYDDNDDKIMTVMTTTTMMMMMMMMMMMVMMMLMIMMMMTIDDADCYQFEQQRQHSVVISCVRSSDEEYLMEHTFHSSLVVETESIPLE